MLKEQMDVTKSVVHGTAPSFERLRAYAQVESETDAKDGALRDTDYELTFRGSEITIKSLKNPANRLDQKQLGILVYGKTLLAENGEVHPMLKETLKCARTLLAEKKDMR